MAKFNLRTTAGSLVLGVLLFAAVPTANAFAQDIQTCRAEIQQLQNRVSKLRAEDVSRYNNEMDQITSWIDEANILIGKDEAKKVKLLSVKIGVYIDFVAASIERDKAMRGATEAESKLKAIKAEYGKLEAQVQQLVAEEEVLQEKLASLKK
ncbi:MAG: hypothetical protein IJU23_11810 [Proteobacteria bacterium]|nr:hypothetical protein [Pseudomonadota bacterium]